MFFFLQYSLSKKTYLYEMETNWKKIIYVGFQDEEYLI